MPESALALARMALESEPSGDTKAHAYLVIGDAHNAMGEYERMAEAYREAAGLAPVGGGDGGNDEAVANDAFRLLGLYYEKTRGWRQAHDMWRRWSPRHFCGNCAAGRHDTRTYHIGRCLWKMGRPDEALKFLDDSEVHKDLGIFSRHRSASLYVDLLRRDSTLDQVEERLGLGSGRKRPNILLGLYLEVLRLAEDEDVEGLWREARRLSDFVIRVPGSPAEARLALADPLEIMPSTGAASDALVSLAGKTKPLLLEAALDRNAQGHLAAVALLGRMGAEEVFPVIRETARREGRHPCIGIYSRALASLGTEDALGLLREWAEGRATSKKWAARRALGMRALEQAHPASP